MKEQCHRCRFFSPDARGFKDRGLCRVGAPAIGTELYAGLGYEALWPVVHVTDWCGQFATRRPK